MWKVELQKNSSQQNSSQLALKLKEQASLFDRPFKQALLYSVLFHFLVFGVFRVQFLQIKDAIQPIDPVEVAIDQGQDSQELVAIAEFDNPKETAAFAPYVKEHLKLKDKGYKADIEHLATSKACFFDEKEIDEKQFHTKLSYPTKHYPLRLEFTSGISKLKLIEDGSNLFKEKNSYFSRDKLPLTFFTIAYNVKVSGTTGKVTEWKRKRELLDKRLQACADRIIGEIQFAPFQENSLKGKIWIVFECSGDEIQEYLYQS